MCVQVHKELNASEEAALSRAEMLVEARLYQLTQAVLLLQLASEASACRELAIICLLCLLAAALVLGMPSRSLGAAWVKRLVAALAVGNGAVGLLLQLRGAWGWGGSGPLALRALPGAPG